VELLIFGVDINVEEGYFAVVLLLEVVVDVDNLLHPVCVYEDESA